MPYLGYGIGADERPMSEYRESDGETLGYHWFEGRIPVLKDQNVLKVDKYFWQSTLHRMFAVELLRSGSFSVYHDHEENHEMFADHCTSEYDLVHTIEKGQKVRTVRKWHQPVKAQNEYFDMSMALLACFSRLNCRWPNVHNWEEKIVEEDAKPKRVFDYVRYD